MLNPGMTDKQIGELVGLSREAVVRRRKRPGYNEVFSEACQSAQDNLKLLFNKAVLELGKALDDPDPKIRLLAASQVMKHLPEAPSKAPIQRKIVIDLSWADENELPSAENAG